MDETWPKGQGGRWSERRNHSSQRPERLAHGLRVTPRSEPGPEDGLPPGQVEGRGELDNPGVSEM